MTKRVKTGKTTTTMIIRARMTTTTTRKTGRSAATETAREMTTMTTTTRRTGRGAGIGIGVRLPSDVSMTHRFVPPPSFFANRVVPDLNLSFVIFSVCNHAESDSPWLLRPQRWWILHQEQERGQKVLRGYGGEMRGRRQEAQEGGGRALSRVGILPWRRQRGWWG